LQFNTSASGCLQGVRFLAVNATGVTYTVEAFNSSKMLVNTATLSNPGVANSYQSVYFADGGVALTANGGTQYVSYWVSTRARQYVVNAYASKKSTGPLVYINSWFQYSPFTNPVVTSGPYSNSDYLVEPIFCSSHCTAPTTASTSTSTSLPTSSITTSGTTTQAGA
jgi:hypothetical protein